MLYGRLPFLSSGVGSTVMLVSRILEGKLEIPTIQSSFHKRKPIPVECRSLLKGMLHPDPEKRFSIEHILRDPWFRQGLPAGFDEYIQS